MSLVICGIRTHQPFRVVVAVQAVQEGVDPQFRSDWRSESSHTKSIMMEVLEDTLVQCGTVTTGQTRFLKLSNSQNLYRTRRTHMRRETCSFRKREECGGQLAANCAKLRKAGMRPGHSSSR